MSKPSRTSRPTITFQNIFLDIDNKIVNFLATPHIVTNAELLHFKNLWKNNIEYNRSPFIFEFDDTDIKINDDTYTTNE